MALLSQQSIGSQVPTANLHRVVALVSSDVSPYLRHEAIVVRTTAQSKPSAWQSLMRLKNVANSVVSLKPG